MKHIHVNLKRFDIPKSMGGVNDYALDKKDWATTIMEKINPLMNQFSPAEYQFTFYFPEAYLIPAKVALNVNSTIRIGCQGVIDQDTLTTNNIGAYTTMRPASAMVGIGIYETIIAHSEERSAKLAMMKLVNSDEEKNKQVLHKVLSDEIEQAQSVGMNVLYCVGESAEERDENRWREVLKQQLTFNLEKIDLSHLKIAYEPIWAIGPNRPVPSVKKIQEVAKFIHDEIGREIPVLYGGGLKATNAMDIAHAKDIDGGLVALTNFSDRIGFYPDQFVDIVKQYISGVDESEEI